MKDSQEIIGITGIPGTGKKTVGRLLAKLLNYDFLDLNQIAIEKNAIIGKDEHGFIADLYLLRKHAMKAIKGKKVVISGHLLPFVFSKREIRFVAILRCSPFELENRFKLRNYSDEKIKDNIASEILGICSYEALRRFGKDKVAEFDTTGRDAKEVAEEIIKVMKGEIPKRVGFIDWLNFFEKAEELSRFFD
ncbi:MAG: adenylate kinase family protein [archaeon]|nr:adenylate kinase family protein [archaeon]MCP8312803.1 adenylate kinase family protein [archaeon]MCP8316559.1 adenylate kinase family protein [archaeon]